MGLKKKTVLLIFAIVLPAILAAWPVAAADPQPEARPDARPALGLIDLRSNFSDGAYDVETLVRMAKERGFSVVVINDHDRMAMEYGLPPLRNVVKKREEKGSINRWGAASWLSAIQEVEKKYPDMIVIPGTETAPFYHWTGSPVTGDLTAWNHERRILTVGLDSPEATAPPGLSEPDRPPASLAPEPPGPPAPAPPHPRPQTPPPAPAGTHCVAWCSCAARTRPRCAPSHTSIN